MTKNIGDGHDISPPPPPWRGIITWVMVALSGALLMANHQPFALWATPLYALTVGSLGDDIILAVRSYADIYNALPGDDPGAGERWGADMACPAETHCGTNSIERGKSGIAWAHLRAAGLLAGPARRDDRPNSAPPHAMAHLAFSFDTAAFGPDETALCSDGVPLPAALRIDRRYDDGDLRSGDIRSYLQAPGKDGDGVPRARLCRKIWR